MGISEIYRGLVPISGGSTESRPATQSPAVKPGQPSEFQKLLQQEGLNLSQHAETRIRSREIPWSPELEKRISGGIDQAESKGSREALILADNVAVIANVKSRTVVTAMDRDQLKERIFTNIDSAVLV